MRILFDLTGLYDHVTGVERYAMEIAKAFCESYPEHKYILVFKNQIHNNFKEICGMENVQSVVIKGKGRLLTGQIKLPLCLYMHGADAYLFLAFPEPLLFFNRNIYTAIHDMVPWEKGNTLKPLSRYYYRMSHIHSALFARYIITISRFSLGRIRKIMRLPLRRIKLIRCGVTKLENNLDVDIFKKYDLPEKYIMTLSTLEPRKRLDLLLEAYDALIKEGQEVPELVIAGRKGWLMDRLFEDRSDELKSRVHFTGFVDDKDMGALYENALAFIFPSEYEGFGMPPLEAMSKGCIVLSSDSSAMPEILGDSALYFKNGDANDMADKIIKILEMGDVERQSFIDKSRHRVRLFSWKKEASKLERIINR